MNIYSFFHVPTIPNLFLKPNTVVFYTVLTLLSLANLHMNHCNVHWLIQMQFRLVLICIIYSRVTALSNNAGCSSNSVLLSALTSNGLPLGAARIHHDDVIVCPHLYLQYIITKSHQQAGWAWVSQSVVHLFLCNDLIPKL